MSQAQHEEFDVVVIGSGNGAMTAGLVAHDHGAKVLLLEKTELFGGTSATSGGGVWIPNNRYARAAGAQDSPEDARAYLDHLTPEDTAPPELIETYLQTGPEMIDYLHENTRWVRYRNLAYYPDYFPHAPGGRSGNRSMEPEPLSGHQLGGALRYLRPQHPQTQMPGGINFTQVEGQVLLGALPGWQLLTAKRLLVYALDLRARWRSLRDYRLTMGNAGVARLYLSLQDRKVPLWRNTAFQDLVIEDGRVVGVSALQQQAGEAEPRTLQIRARRGVILAAGGFERNQQMREEFLPHPTQTQWSSANLYNTGDAHRAAMAAGAATHQMHWAWWATTGVIPGRDKAQMMMVEKSMPGNYTVNRNGRRFSNESQNYVGFVEDMFRRYQAGDPCIPCYMIFDADFRRNRPCGPLVQGKFMPDWMLPRSWWTPDFLMKGRTLRELAQKVGIDADGLEQTQRQVNEYARTGKDLDFQRGDSVYDRYYGDPTFKPNPCLGALKTPPFYSMALFPGEMGTAGGLVVDRDARVLRADREPIPGLYATGNCTSALLPRYPGPGATLGPAMVFGYRAGLHITREQA